MTPTCTPERLDAAYQTALAALLAERHPDGYWVGELSSSALSTATAVMALHLMHNQPAAPPRTHPHQNLIHGGLRWLVEHQNTDGGWGDTTKSFSNISTTMLCRAAMYLTGAAPRLAFAVNRAEAWLHSKYGNTPEQLAEAVRARYGKDRTFATPILTTCALAGLVSWKEVPPLPFELAVFPQSWFRFLRLHVVSYALPALIAIGQCIHHHKKPWNPFARLLRWLSKKRSLRVLEKIQPSSGGFLEAIPLTSFVTLSLAACGLADHPVAKKGVEFLVSAARPDGSWAIDSNLSTWVTTLAINALTTAGDLDKANKTWEAVHWLVKHQVREFHPYTGAWPGGWGWTYLPGSVPDGDDTAGAILALLSLNGLIPNWLAESLRRFPDWMEAGKRFVEAVRGNSSHDEQFVRDYHLTYGLHPGSWICEGLQWLSNLQNRDGGWPTFCRGWGHLPFDRSGTDLTAHAMRAIAHDGRIRFEDIPGKPECYSFLKSDVKDQALSKGWNFLARSQRSDGSWLPLWFGNQHAPDDENPTYGTARVLAAYRDLGMMDSEPARRGVAWLLSVQNADGGWGGAKDTPSSVEETALAVEILIHPGEPGANAHGSPIDSAVDRGLAYLIGRVETGGLYEPSPIGFYFAKLWYFEKLYPIIFTVAALGRARGAYKSQPPRI